MKAELPMKNLLLILVAAIIVLLAVSMAGSFVSTGSPFGMFSTSEIGDGIGGIEVDDSLISPDFWSPWGEPKPADPCKDVVCPPGQYCDNGKCVDKKDIGEGCTDDKQCASGVCNKIYGVCT